MVFVAGVKDGKIFYNPMRDYSFSDEEPISAMGVPVDQLVSYRKIMDYGKRMDCE